ncbi:hypothetical protein JTM61_17160 [Pseudomonas aeruginosa]|uniref:hypothetical protein n=1 Tax=Pseudomonas aeruginosa TaxID=287 RepID=UPI0015D4AC5A|nr:hypothetical protein [Pseudomonas aeruginosa]MBN0375827.1 hypothetical protein [Pseudomonas aeruginosa]NYU77725.1 hypothetical protein [Pseudomonas aeruginosa]
MTKANECTCPSGDGSLRHPCPAHIGPFDKLVGSPVHNESEPDLPPLDEHLAQVFETGMALRESVEQAGGDERAVDGKPRATRCPHCGESDLMPGDLCTCGYETDPAAGYACSECDGSGDGYVGEVCRECDGSGWFVTPEQARAALAQPSPASDLDPLNLAPHAEAFNEAPAEALKPEQAEAERPEIVATLFTPNEKVHDDIGFKAFAVAGDCDKDGGEFYDPEKLMTVAQHGRIVGELRTEIAMLRSYESEWELLLNQHEQERDAALAEVECLRESKGDPSGSFDRCMKMMYERDENAKRLDAALARVAELTATRNRYGVDAHYFNKNLQRILRDFESFTPDELARSLIILAKVADEKVVAQAQHSVPDDVETFLGEVRAELLRARSKFPGDRIMTIAIAEEFGELCKAVLDEPAANVRKEAVQTAVMAARVVLDGDGSVTAWRAERGLDPLAAAPGKEGL